MFLTAHGFIPSGLDAQWLIAKASKALLTINTSQHLKCFKTRFETLWQWFLVYFITERITEFPFLCMYCFVEMTVTMPFDRIQEYLPCSQQIVLLYHASHFGLAKFPKLERLLSIRAVETQLLLGSSETLLLKVSNPLTTSFRASLIINYFCSSCSSLTLYYSSVSDKSKWTTRISS